MDRRIVKFYSLEGEKMDKSINSQVAAWEEEILSFVVSVRMLMEELRRLIFGPFWVTLSVVLHIVVFINYNDFLFIN